MQHFKAEPIKARSPPIYHHKTTAMLNLNSDFEKEAIVDEEIRPNRTGRVYFQGSWWPARCQQNVTLAPGKICYVINICNITLFVEPAPFN